MTRVTATRDDQQRSAKKRGTQEKKSAAREQPLYLRRINPRTALVVAAAFNAILGVAMALAGYLVIFVASRHGVLDQVNTVTSDLGTSGSQRFSVGRLCLLWTGIVAGWIVVATVLVALVTAIFNNLLHLLGGLELDVTRTPGEKPDLVTPARRLAASGAATLRERVAEPIASRLSSDAGSAELEEGREARTRK